MKGFLFFTNFRDCSVKTELICRNNYAKNSLNCFLSGTKMNRQFSMSPASELNGGQRDVFLFSISAQRQTSGLTACAEYPFARVCLAAKFRQKGRRTPSSATPRGRPPQTRNDHDPPHTAERPPQARQAAAYPPRCSFHLLPTLVYRRVSSKRRADAENRDNARQAAVSTERP